MREAELPFFIDLMQHLAAKGFPCPTPIADRNGRALQALRGKPAALVSFLNGVSVRRPSPAHCREAGVGLARLHLAGDGLKSRRANDLAQPAWAALYADQRPAAEALRPGLAREIDEDLAMLALAWPRGLPTGLIHADLFPDNVFFMDGRFSAAIDFYFACEDAFAYDLAICLNAWCFEVDGAFNVTAARALVAGYQSLRPLSPGGAVRPADPGARGGHALLPDPLDRLGPERRGGPGATKGSHGIRAKARLPPSRRRRAQSVRGRMTPVTIYTDGACSGNPGPGGWGAILMSGGRQREIMGGEAATTNNRMELMAAIRALEALTRPCKVELHTDSQYVRQGITEWMKGWKARGWKTADKKPVKNEDLWRQLDAARARHEVDWRWVKGHAGDPLNERADALARAGLKAARDLKRAG